MSVAVMDMRNWHIKPRAKGTQHCWILLFCVCLHTLLLVAACCWELLRKYYNRSKVWLRANGSPNIVGPTMLGIVASAYKTVIFIRPKRWLWQFTQLYLKRHFSAKMNCAYFYVTPFPLPTRLGLLQLGLWRKNGWLRPCHRGNLSSLFLNNSVSSFTYHPSSLTRGTFRQVPTSELVYVLWNVPIQIFAICYIILEVYDGFRYRKGLHSTLGWYII